MEPLIVDYYNETPQMFGVVEKMNEEFEEIMDKNLVLVRKNIHLEKKLLMKMNDNLYSIERNISREKLKKKTKSLEVLKDKISIMIGQFLNSEGWVKNLTKPYWNNIGIMGKMGLGHWDTFLQSGIPVSFLRKGFGYGTEEYLYEQKYYCSYLKLKILEELFFFFNVKLVHQHEHGLFHILLDNAFVEVEKLIMQIINWKLDVEVDKLKGMVKKTILMNLFYDPKYPKTHVSEQYESTNILLPLNYVYYHECDTCKEIINCINDYCYCDIKEDDE